MATQVSKKQRQDANAAAEDSVVAHDGSGVGNSSERVSFFRMFASTLSSKTSGATRQELQSVGGLSNEAAAAERRRRPSLAASVSSGADATSSPTQDPATRRHRAQQRLATLGRRFCHPSPATIDIFEQFLNSWVWRLCFAFNTLLLLFGFPVQNLLPRGSDLVFDILYCLCLAFFTSDMVLRLYVEPNYFNFVVCGRRSAWGRCHIGSFLFWCDLASTCTLLYNISWINRDLTKKWTIDLELNQLGMPVSGLDQVNRTLPVETEVPLLLLIARTARMARFIRSHTVVETRSRINWHKLTKLNPFWAYEDWKQKKRRASASIHDSTRQVSTSSAEMTSQNEGSGEDSNQRRKSSKSMMLEKSWGGLHVGVVAAARARQMREENHGFVGFIVKALRFFRVLRNDDEELRRQIAAIRIQRWWRQSYREESQDLSLQEDVAWTSNRSMMRGSGSTSRRTTRKPRQKRSIMRMYEQLNKKNIRKKEDPADAHGLGGAPRRPSSSQLRSRRPESQVGSAMRELTGQRVALGIILSLVLTVMFSYVENDATRPSSMIVLHGQTFIDQFAGVAIEAARESSIPDLFEYEFPNGTTATYKPITGENPSKLRDREILEISIEDPFGFTTAGQFANADEMRTEAIVQILLTVLVLLCWYLGVDAFAGPLAILVVVPIERMVRLLGMLMVDPLGYQSTSRYKRFVSEEEEITRNTRWTKEVLKGMETSFLMSTILRIGSLMKVGFGSAGVEIIRNNLERGQSKNMLILNSQGSTVSCIFLFCDIRQFTDATECLQEEVFVFTNRIAAVVHSICHAYGGSANKNIGDAFLLSWSLEEQLQIPGSQTSDIGPATSRDTFVAKHHQADKALLSVVKIAIALHHDKHYVETLSETAREALLKKLSKRKGPVVQLGFGLHAGKAVQGAIGSQRKIDATYVSESVERAEFLESSTKKYGLKMLMSDSFHRLLHSSNRRRCRKIDQILFQNEDDDDDEAYLSGDVMELFTFDMDIDALWRIPIKNATDMSDAGSEASGSSQRPMSGSKKDNLRPQASVRHVPGGLLGGPRRRRSMRFQMKNPIAGEVSGEMTMADAAAQVAAGFNAENNEHDDEHAAPVYQTPEFSLPSGPAMYNSNVWLSDDMRRIRQRYSDGLFFQKFNSGFLAFYARDWEHAKQCFQTILERFDDGPSRYFLSIIEENSGIPPRNFLGYGTA